MLHLQDLAKQNSHTETVTLNERLPSFLSGPCQLKVTYKVEGKDDFYLIYLEVLGELKINCQRCMQEFNYPYDNSTRIAVCRSDERAEQLLEQYECIVSSKGQVLLSDLITDELHLYAPQFHLETKDCDHGIMRILNEKKESI